MCNPKTSYDVGNTNSVDMTAVKISVKFTCILITNSYKIILSTQYQDKKKGGKICCPIIPKQRTKIIHESAVGKNITWKEC